MKLIYLVLMIIYLTIPQISYCQYFQRLYDCDSTNDWGRYIFLNNDGSSYFIISAISIPAGYAEIESMTISLDGNIVINKHNINVPYSYIYTGNAGEVKKMTSGNYIAPYTIQTPNITYGNSTTGFMKLNPVGDTVFAKIYYDTSVNYAYLYCSNILPNGDFLGGGVAKNNSYPNTALLIKADSLGDTIYTKNYLIDSLHAAPINTVEPLNNGSTVLIGAVSTTLVYYSSEDATIAYNAPWFIITDSMGNIIKDTLYDYHDYWERFSSVEGGHLYKDKNGGYFHYGWLNQIIVPSNLGSNYNFSSYFAHLDTNFRIDWIRKFPYSDTFGKRIIFRISQLLDSNYIIYGGNLVDSVPYATGWMAKIDKGGNILWQRTYLSDTLNDCYIEDLIEKPDGSMVFVGATFNDTLPSWHYHRDVWLVGLDSNGCDVGGCAIPTRLLAVAAPPEVISIFPNPTNGNITISAIEGGVFALYSLDGRRVFECAVEVGKTEVRLPAFLSKGVYMGKFVGEDGWVGVVRVVCLN